MPQDGEYIVRQGDRGDMFFVIIFGVVRITKASEDATRPNEEVLITRRGPSEYFGEMAMLDPSCLRTANCIAEGEVECMFLHRLHFNSILPLKYLVTRDDLSPVGFLQSTVSD